MQRETGLVYAIEYSRRPFFLRPNWNVEGWLDGLGLPLDATKAEVNAQQGKGDGIRRLFREAGVVSPRAICRCVLCIYSV